MEFEPDQRAFVDAVMQPLGADPPRLELLEEAVALSSTLPGQAIGDDALTAAERMKRTSRSFRRWHRILPLVWAAIFVAVAWLAIVGPGARKSLSDIWDVNRVANAVSTMCCSHEGVPRFPNLLFPREKDAGEQFLRHIAQDVPAAQRPLLVGETAEPDPVSKWRRVWDRHPRDPAHYFASALAHHKELGAWPEHFVGNGEELDPGNGWFRLVAGASQAKASIGEPPAPKITKAERLAAREKGLPPPQTPKPSKPKRQVIDPVGFQQGWESLEVALAMPRWHDYRSELNAIRLAAVPPPDDFAAWSRGLYFSIFQPEDNMSDWLELRSYHEGLRLAADEATKAGDSERLAALDALQRKFVRKLGIALRSQLMEAIMVRATALSGGRTLEKAWTEAGDASKAKRWKDLTTAIDPNLKPDLPPTPEMLGENRGSNVVVSGLIDMTSYRTPESALLTDADLRGGRLAEYAVYERLMMHGIALLLLLALGFLLLTPHLHRKEIGPLGSRLAGLLDTRDRLRILAIGVILPATVYLLSTRLPWLGTRDASISAIGFFLWIGQSVAFVVSVLLGTLQATRRQLGRRGAVLSLGWVGLDPGRLSFPAALAIMPLAA